MVFLSQSAQYHGGMVMNKRQHDMTVLSAPRNECESRHFENKSKYSKNPRAEDEALSCIIEELN